MFKQGTIFYTSDIESDVLKPFDNEEVIKYLNEKYIGISAAFIPDKYEVAFLLFSEDRNDSYQDVWKIVFYKKVLKMPELTGGTITLDNLEALQSSGTAYEVYKELDGTFEDVIKISCDLISKHRSGYEKELHNLE